MDVVITLLTILLCVVLIQQFVGINTPVGIVLLIVVVLLVFGYHGRGYLFH